MILLQLFPMDLFLVHVNVYVRHHRSSHFHMHFLTMNNRLFSLCDVSYRFNVGKNNKVVLELTIWQVIMK